MFSSLHESRCSCILLKRSMNIGNCLMGIRRLLPTDEGECESRGQIQVSSVTVLSGSSRKNKALFFQRTAKNGQPENWWSQKWNICEKDTKKKFKMSKPFANLDKHKDGANHKRRCFKKARIWPQLENFTNLRQIRDRQNGEARRKNSTNNENFCKKLQKKKRKKKIQLDWKLVVFSFLIFYRKWRSKLSEGSNPGLIWQPVRA